MFNWIQWNLFIYLFILFNHYKFFVFALRAQKVSLIDFWNSSTDAVSLTSTVPSGEDSIDDMMQVQQPFVVSYKNQLQEHCQKRKISLPVYESSKRNGLFGCQVTVQGKIFTSSNCKTKKGSEQTAARLALQFFGPCLPAQVWETDVLYAVESAVADTKPRCPL